MLDGVRLPRPELRLIQRPIGPVAVYGASKFPWHFPRQAVAESLAGQLTCTLHLYGSDAEGAGAPMLVFEREVGRILANGLPTGVAIRGALIHGGPYPANTNFLARHLLAHW